MRMGPLIATPTCRVALFWLLPPTRKDATVTVGVEKVGVERNVCLEFIYLLGMTRFYSSIARKRFGRNVRH
ncbi:hypothetical protein V8C44DRAFT_325621 [Trichoderma aethiopicum]